MLWIKNISIRLHRAREMWSCMQTNKHINTLMHTHTVCTSDVITVTKTHTQRKHTHTHTSEHHAGSSCAPLDSAACSLFPHPDTSEWSPTLSCTDSYCGETGSGGQVKLSRHKDVWKLNADFTEQKPESRRLERRQTFVTEEQMISSDSRHAWQGSGT